MKKSVLLLITGMILTQILPAQTILAPDQNPNFAVSRDKYMRLSDSMNQWHGLTLQDTYKAPDWYEQKMERKASRKEFRRDIRLERNRNAYRYYNPSPYYQPYYNRPYNNYNYRRPYYRQGHPWGLWWRY